MNDDCDTAQLGNPFSSRFVRPGAIPYTFGGGTTADDLVDRLADDDWRAQIVGSHGSGKSTLLAALLPAIRARGRTPTLFELHDGQRRLPADWKTVAGLDSNGVLVIDGYEQLGLPARWAVRRYCRKTGCGLLVTTHKRLRLPLLYHTAPTLDFVQTLVDRLLEGRRSTIKPEDVAAIYDARNGNVRNVLFDLYDLYEERRTTPQ